MAIAKATAPLAAFGLVGALAIALSVRPPAATTRVAAIASALAQVAAAALAARRALARREERAGWLLVAGAYAPWMASGAVLALGSARAEPGPGVLGLYLGLALLTQLLGLVGFLVWPWRPPPARRRLDHLLGSALVAGSLVLLLWIAGTWAPRLLFNPTEVVVLLGLCARFTLWGGPALYLALEAPRRLSGPLGWEVCGLVGGAFTLALMQVLLSAYVDIPRPLYALALLPHACAALAALSPRPVEAGGAGGEERLDLLLHVPYVVAGGILLMVPAARGTLRSPGPATGFLALTVVLAIRQVLRLLGSRARPGRGRGK